MELRISFEADRETVSRIRKLFPSASVKGNVCQVVISGRAPADVARQVQRLLKSAGRPTRSPKGFK